MTVEHEKRILNSSHIAELIIGDTIFSAHTTPELSGDTTVQETLDLMLGPQADEIVQGLMSRFCVARTTPIPPGEKPGLDSRLAGKLFTVTPNELKEELIGGLQKYLSLPQEERIKHLGRLKEEREHNNYKDLQAPENLVIIISRL